MQNETLSRRFLSFFILLILIPSIIAIGMFVLKDKSYLFISLTIIFLTILVFIMRFENRKPNSREIVLISVLSAIAVVGRMAFFMIPQFKPIMAIVIISGVALGGEAGFLVGSLSAFVSNFFFGQGSWTPWQMFSFGMAGLISGLIFYNRKIRNNRILLCLYGGLLTMVLYGGLMNFYSLLSFSSSITKEGIIAIYLSGIPFDLVHAISTIFFLFIASKSMLEKIDRIKVKYGLFEG